MEELISTIMDVSRNLSHNFNTLVELNNKARRILDFLNDPDKIYPGACRKGLLVETNIVEISEEEFERAFSIRPFRTFKIVLRTDDNAPGRLALRVISISNRSVIFFGKVPVHERNCESLLKLLALALASDRIIKKLREIERSYSIAVDNIKNFFDKIYNSVSDLLAFESP